MKSFLVSKLNEAGYEVIDHGAETYDELDHYPTMCIPCAEAVVADPGSLGIVIGGSGNGEQIAANKVEGVRAALVWSIATAELAREHNDANVIAIGARQHTFEEAVTFIDRFIATPFSGEERHARRIAQLADFERDGSLLPDPRAGQAASGPAPHGGESVDAFDPEAG